MRDAPFNIIPSSLRALRTRRAHAAPSVLSVLGGLVVIALTLAWATRPTFNAFESDQFVEVTWRVVTDGLFAIAFSIAAYGYGSILSRHLLGRFVSGPVSLALGWAILLWGQHAFGALGILQTGRWHAWAWMWPLVGILAAIATAFRSVTHPPSTTGVRVTDESGDNAEGSVVDENLAHALGVDAARGYGRLLWLIACPVIALILVAATSAPGWLWATEAYGYDVLSYHLQLPKEWHALGGITPLEHNVYSFLPSYVEAAFYHVMCVYGLFNDVVYAAIACQLVHVAITFACGLAVADVVRTITRSIAAAALAGTAVIALPWTMVVGSMAYNEMAVVLMFAAGVRLVLEPGIRGWRMGLALGLLGGVACGAKLTAIGFVAVPLFVAALIYQRPRTWLAITLMMAVGGIVALAPYFARNAMACGNPVFPFLADTLGSAHWTSEQVTRWNTAHFTSMNPTDLLGSFLDMALRHEQWALLWWFGAIGGIAAIRFRARRRAILLATAVIVVQIAFWAIFTHRQSRFLLPSIVPLAMLLGMACPQIADRRRVVAIAATVILACAPLSLTVSSISVYRGQRNGKPASMIAGGVEFRTGDIMTQLPREVQDQHLNMNADAWINHRTNLEYGLYLLGDATPYYITRPDVIYHTTWDTSPLGALVREHPDNPRAWADGVHALGVRLVMVNHAEVYRLSVKDGWYDPDVTPELVEHWTDEEMRRIRSWTDPNDVRIRSLYRLRTYQGGDSP